MLSFVGLLLTLVKDAALPTLLKVFLGLAACDFLPIQTNRFIRYSGPSFSDKTPVEQQT